MELVADILLISGALAAAVYCIVLSRRLRRFTDLEKGVGGAIAMLSMQVDDMTRTLEAAQSSALDSTRSLGDLTDRAEGVARRLELLVAAMHDLPAPPEPAPAGAGTSGTGAAGGEEPPGAAAAATEQQRPADGASDPAMGSGPADSVSGPAPQAGAGADPPPGPEETAEETVAEETAAEDAPLFFSHRQRATAAE